MEITESRRLYQQLAAELKDRIEQGVYLVGDKLPAERFIADEKSVSRTVVREAIIMLEVEGYVEVRKGSGIHVISSQAKHSPTPDESLEFASYGPFELLQARQLIESNIAEFAATQVTKQDIMKLMEIQDHARKEKCFRDSEWDLQFHVQVALATQNTALAAIVEKMWTQRVHNPYWKKLHDHIDSRTVGVLCAKGAMAFPQTVLLLTIAASLGCWVSYIQGRWLGNTRIVQNWLSHLPAHYHQRAHHLFHKHGLSALLIGRFIAFVRTLLPTIAGLSGLSSARFQFFNWMSGLLWVLILTTLGYALGKTPVFMKYEDQLMSCLMLLPVVLLVFGLVGSLVVLWKKKYGARG